jgi:2'-5' RNA ligase
LLGIVERLHAGLRERGFELRVHDTFCPHVTLVRDAVRRPAAASVVPVQWAVESLALVESQVGQRGSEYTVLEEWRLN